MRAANAWGQRCLLLAAALQFRFDQEASMAAIDFGLNGRPRSFKKPRAANSAAIARRLSFPPFGFFRASAFASLTTSGLASAWLLRPSTFTPVAMRFRFRAAASFATVSPFQTAPRLRAPGAPGRRSGYPRRRTSEQTPQ